jgi:hypothetical protein
MHAPELWAACSELGWNLVNSSCENDFRMLLTLQELRAIAGHETCMRILSALETETPDAIVLRRTVASGRWIDFHTDTVARTVQVRSVSRLRRMFPLWLVTRGVQVPLTDDSACEGGLLVFACSDGRLVHAKRRMGAMLAHDGDAVHGVTALVKGTRLVAVFFVFLVSSSALVACPLRIPFPPSCFPSPPSFLSHSLSATVLLLLIFLILARMYGLFVLRVRSV